ncbi:MAG: hypothetical protein QM758_25785 [Armatimonas sp.]
MLPQAPPPPVSYTRQILPLLHTACLGCHGVQNPAAKLSVGSLTDLMKGGAHGAAIVPGKSGQSRLYQMLTGTVKPIMPPGPGLKAAEIELFRRWIDEGAKDDAASTTSTSIAKPTRPAAPVITAPKPIGKALSVGAPINALAYSPDGKLLAVGTYQRVLLYDAATKAISKIWTGHGDAVRALRFSPDGKWLAAGGGAPGAIGQVRLWSVAEKREIRSYGIQTDTVNAVAFSPDSTKLAAASSDRTIVIYDAILGRPLQTLRDHADAVLGVAWQPGGKLLASCSVDKSVKIWDATSGKRLYSPGGHDDAVNALAFTPNGAQLVSGGSDRLARLWNIGPESGGQVRAMGGHSSPLFGVSISPDSQVAATVSGDRMVRLWRLSDGVNTSTLIDAKDWLYSVAIRPDGKQITAGAWDGTLYFWTLDPNTLVGTVETWR